MLVLTRRPGEKVKIGHRIEITVVQVRGDSVRIGIDAPKDVAVHRKEVYDSIAQEAVEANQEMEKIEGFLREEKQAQ